VGVGLILALSQQLRGLSKLPTIVRYGLTTLLVGLALAAGYTLGTPPFLFFFPTVLIVAVVFDHGTSIYATLLSAALVAAFLMAPGVAPPMPQLIELMSLAVFIVSSIAIGSVVEAMRHAIEELSAVNKQLVHVNAESDAKTLLLDAIVEQTPDPIYVKDRDGRFLHLNSAAAQLLGVAPTKAIGRRDRDFLSVEQAALIEANDQSVMTSGTAQVVEEPVSQPGQAPRLFLSTKAPWQAPDGSGLGVVGISRDISVRKEAENALKAADAAKQLLLYDINHRIKNHLQSVSGLMAIAARRATTLMAAQGALTAAVGRMAVLGQVYTRLQLGAETSVVNTRSFIEELCDELAQSLIDSRPISIRCDAVATPLDSGRAVTVGLFINEVVQNALKYAFPGDRAGTVRTRLSADADDYLLVVEDDGIGFDTAAAPIGTGAGQRLIRAMAQQLGGTLDIAGPPGTRYTLRFPRVGD